MSIHRRQTLRVTSADGFGRRLPTGTVGQFLANLEPVVRQSILMAFEGRSSSPGRDPKWFVDSSDVRFVDLSEDHGDTLLHFEAPELGDAAAPLYKQQELFQTRPPPTYTGIDLVGRVVDDVDRSNGDSARFDAGLLKSLARFQSVFSDGFTDAWVPEGDGRSVARLSSVTVDNARKLTDRTPAPRAVRVAGRLDMIWDSRRSFGIQLDDGQEVRGVWKGDVADLGLLLRKRVLVIGQAVYRPSGRLLRIDAESLESGEGESTFFSVIPPPLAVALDVKTLRRPATPGEGMRAFFGTWPGEESEAELLHALEDFE